jgi:hypothetical protein
MGLKKIRLASHLYDTNQDIYLTLGLSDLLVVTITFAHERSQRPGYLADLQGALSSLTLQLNLVAVLELLEMFGE